MGRRGQEEIPRVPPAWNKAGGPWEKENVERVRNPEDGTYRR